MTDAPLLTAENLTVRVPGRDLVCALDLELRRGGFLAVLGQNGAGKSLTLLTLAGLRAADGGSVQVGGSDPFSSPRQQTARRLGLLPQDVDDVFPATVFDTALTGRHPHIARFARESADDHDIVLDALATTGLAALADRDVLTLSGGERRRLAIAQLLAQAPDVYLLDEPSNHLDPQHQLQMLQVFRDLADAGAAVAASLHDVNLAVRFADRCLLLYGDGRWEIGATAALLTETRLSALFATPMEAVAWRSQRLFVASGDEARQ